MKATITTVLILGMMGLAITTATAATVTDNFATSHDYLTSGVAGTIWSGVLNAGGAQAMNTTTTPGALTVSVATGRQWGWGVWNAPMLYIDAVGDFEANVTVTDSGKGINWWKASLMAYVDNGNIMQIQLISPVDYDRTNGANWQDGAAVGAGEGGGEGNYWTPFAQMKMVRTVDSFQMYVRHNDTETWTTYGFGPMVRNDLNGVPVKIGLSFETADGAASSAHFDNFSLTTVPEPAGMLLLGCGGLLTLYRRRK